ncbi:toxin-antitoxin system TumE family protein [Desulfonatronum thioautotrophicum]|uniref:toxin-antitoxin system TumE family protein n=1 Tax=Desulfonatronum thioautotrophicum TaxID=617001 RepID=UPI0005EB2C0C|nr:DUF6516 family protein [Desulfonatronum thioautotrophicum]
MLSDLIEKHKNIIASWTVTNFDREGANLRLKAEVVFIDKSRLFIRQVVLIGIMLKYAYHWQNQDEMLIIRWDNAGHWPDVATFPHHKHVCNDEKIQVLPSRAGADLAEILKEIARTLQPHPLQP